MNLFRSEEHARNWDRFNEATETTLRPVDEWADIFSNRFFRERSRPDYISWVRSEEGTAAFAELKKRAR